LKNFRRIKPVGCIKVTSINATVENTKITSKRTFIQSALQKNLISEEKCRIKKKNLNLGNLE
jgi:hypothetical protein